MKIKYIILLLLFLLVLFTKYYNYKTDNFNNINNIVEYFTKEESLSEIKNEAKIKVVEEIISEENKEEKKCKQNTIKNQKMCNKSITNNLTFGCKKLMPFNIESYNTNQESYDPTEFYKNNFQPILLNLEDKDVPYVGANMPDYNNIAKIQDIGKINLDKNKVIPVQNNYVFKDSSSFLNI